jgi:glucose-1-phosphate thymidylyltransferase
VDELLAGDSDVVLGVIPAANLSKVDVVEISNTGKVISILPKPDSPSSARAWIAAAWRPTFTEYLHQFLVDFPARINLDKELYLGDVLAASLTELDVCAVVCDDGRFIDIGTPEDLAQVRAEC